MRRRKALFPALHAELMTTVEADGRSGWELTVVPMARRQLVSVLLADAAHSALARATDWFGKRSSHLASHARNATAAGEIRLASYMYRGHSRGPKLPQVRVPLTREQASQLESSFSSPREGRCQ